MIDTINVSYIHWKRGKKNPKKGKKPKTKVKKTKKR